MATPEKVPKFVEVEDSVTGYMHNVSPLKVALRSRNKYFNATIQSARDKYHRVVVFDAGKHDVLVQAEKMKSPVKLKNVKRCVSQAGGEFDVQCGKNTEVLVTELDFFARIPPGNAKRTVAEIAAMAGKQQVGSMEATVIHVTEGTETVECRGIPTEMQTCHVRDHTGVIKIQLWDAQVGSLAEGHTYMLTKLSTRLFDGPLYLTTTRDTEIVEIAPLQGLSSDVTFSIAEKDVISLIGAAVAVEFHVSHKCIKCQKWQEVFDCKGRFHRCERCGMLRKSGSYQPTTSGNITIDAAGVEYEVSMAHSCLKKYLETEGLMSLMMDGRDIEEHFLIIGDLQFQIQGTVVTAVKRVLAEASVTGEASKDVAAVTEETTVAEKAKGPGYEKREKDDGGVKCGQDEGARRGNDGQKKKHGKGPGKVSG